MSDGGRTPGRVRVVVADDHPLYRDGVVRALSASGRVEILAEAADGVEALSAIRGHAPDVAVVDYELPGLDGVQVAESVARENPAVRVLILSAHADGGLVDRALDGGAAGYMLKEAHRNEIVDGVLACARGDTVLPATLPAGVGPPARRLTERESQILRAIAAGRSLQRIADDLHVAVTTVKTHTQHLYGKLGVSDRAAAVAEAMRRGLIE